MDFRKFLNENTVILDGAMGTLLQEYGIAPGELPEKLNINSPDLITKIHREYFDAGSNVVSINSFGANSLKFSSSELDSIIRAAVSCAKRAREESSAVGEKFIALDIGPSGKLLKPLGDFDFEDAVELFAKTVRIGVKYGVDLIILETFTDSYETKAALLAVKENCNLPVIVTNAYGQDGKLMTGASPEAMAALLEGMGADAIGANCSFGPDLMISVCKRLLDVASVPIVVKPNAGLPRIEDGRTFFDIGKKDFANVMLDMAKLGAKLLGGCCGTTPEYIKELKNAVKDVKTLLNQEKNISVISSYASVQEFGAEPVLIGERINPTGKKRFKEAIRNRDFDYILGEAVGQEENGAMVLDVNVGLPETDEIKMLADTVREIQTVTALPLQIDSADPKALEGALRVYNGKAMINSVNGKEASMRAVFPLVKKYGGLVVALTLDEKGIPDTAEGRFEIAKKILHRAAEYGIKKCDIIFDTLTMAVSADKNAATVTLDALALIRERLDAKTILGVSNVSFGLPCRDALNSAFFTLALGRGLSAAIMNPHSSEMMSAYKTYRALAGLDEGFSDYIASAENFSQIAMPVLEKSSTLAAENGNKSKENFTSELMYSIVKGLSRKTKAETEAALAVKTPMAIINEEIIPALSYAGAAFESGAVYLPSLLASAECAKCAFEIIKDRLSANGDIIQKGENFVLATVKGDIHDIGKNIVKLLLENYGYHVIDLGKDVEPETVRREVLNCHAKLLGLSALMTTTVPAMKETVRIVKEACPDCKIIVGGAVLTAEYAEKIGADAYAKDAMETVRLAKNLLAH